MWQKIYIYIYMKMVAWKKYCLVFSKNWPNLSCRLKSSIELL
jgi:hypothetical protein